MIILGFPMILISKYCLIRTTLFQDLFYYSIFTDHCLQIRKIFCEERTCQALRTPMNYIRLKNYFYVQYIITGREKRRRVRLSMGVLALLGQRIYEHESERERNTMQR